ncbi:hypothetical protein [Leptonema illini]|uniref:Uncharacterized protein n=1 Tax=Leptonema illini DSM 21528 TaxID=929563 RepID=H2CJ55_9LEPT|nr:hypothetical protein [Leptonema illini]EHQ04972.1 hypothetical protein Lepil_0265 [Leptonema illini DSM 21528]
MAFRVVFWNLVPGKELNDSSLERIRRTVLNGASSPHLMQFPTDTFVSEIRSAYPGVVELDDGSLAWDNGDDGAFYVTIGSQFVEFCFFDVDSENREWAYEIADNLNVDYYEGGN